VADAFRKEGRTEARSPKQPAQLSQAASVKDLVTYYDMGHYVGGCSARCKTCCKDGRSKVLIDEDTTVYPGARGVCHQSETAQLQAQRQATLRGLHDTPADRFTFCATEGKAVFESGEIWPDLPIFYLLPCAHPTCPNRLELSPGCMGWSWNRQNHPARPLWPREIISRRLRDRAPVGALPPSPEQRDKVAPLGKGVKPPRRTGYCRELEATGGLCRPGNKPPFTHESQLRQSGGLCTRAYVGPYNLQSTSFGNHPIPCRPGFGLEEPL
jgi:hypothetical protein